MIWAVVRKLECIWESLGDLDKMQVSRHANNPVDSNAVGFSHND